MIRPLRRLHLGVLAALAPPIVVLYAAALGTRPSAPVADLGELVAPPTSVDARSLDWSTAGLSGWWEPTSASVTVELAKDVVAPNMLLYCANSSSGDDLPPGAWVLGDIRPGERRRFSLTGACAPGDELLLFSLGHRIVLARARLSPDAEGPP